MMNNCKLKTVYPLKMSFFGGDGGGGGGCVCVCVCVCLYVSGGG